MEYLKQKPVPLLKVIQTLIMKDYLVITRYDCVYIYYYQLFSIVEYIYILMSSISFFLASQNGENSKRLYGKWY